MIYDAEKNALILRLRKLSKLKDKTPYAELKKAIIKKYDTTGRTVERWLNKRTPGARKGRNDSGKPRVKTTAKEKKMAAELLETGKKIQDVRKITEERTGRKMSQRRLDRIREESEPSPPLMNQGTPSGGGHTDMPETNFGDEAKELFRKLFDLDLIAPERGVPVMVNGRRFAIPKEDVEDVCLILANAYNRTGQARFKVDRSRLLKMRIMHLIEQQVRMATVEQVDTKTIESITRMYDKMLENIKVDANIRTVEKVCKELKPDISFEEIISLIEKHTDGID